jgi:hypothetical protein
MRLFRWLIALMLVMAMSPLTAQGALAATPVNDERAGAISVTGFPFQDTVDLAEATPGLEDGACAEDGPSVWYRYVPGPEDGRITLTVESSSGPVVVGFFGEMSDGSLWPFECITGGWTTISTAFGETYYFMVATPAWNPTPGPVTFNLEGPPPPPPPAEVSGSVTGGTVSRTGIVNLTGTVTCTGTYFAVFAEVWQSRGKFTATGQTWASGLCGEQVSFLPLEDATGAPFRPGPVQVTMVAETWGEAGFETTGQQITQPRLTPTR